MKPSEYLSRTQLTEMYYFARLARDIEERLVILFRRIKDEVPDDDYVVPSGKPPSGAKERMVAAAKRLVEY